MRHLFAPLLFAALLVLGAPLAAGAQPAQAAPVEVRFSYPGPAAWTGDFQGSCRAVGIQFDEATESLAYTSQGGEIVTTWTRVNYTVINPEENPWIHAIPDKQWSRTEAVPAGKGTLTWGDDGLATAYSNHPDAPEALNLDVTYRASELRAGPLDPRGNVPGWWKPSPQGDLFVTSLDYLGLNREFRHVGAAEADGPVTFYLRHAVLETANWRHEMPPYGTVESDVSAPRIQHRQVVYAEAFLTLQDARFSLGPADVAVCRSLSGSHDGSFVASTASGEARHGPEVLSFENRALSLEGRFEMVESPADVTPSTSGGGSTETTAQGAITLIGLDFSTAAVPGKFPDAAKVGFVAALVVAVAAALYKWSGAAFAFFYSRLSRDEILEAARRDSLLQAIRENPGIAQKDLRTITSIPWTSLRYHVRILNRAGFVTVSRYGLSRRLFARDNTPRVDAGTLALAADERVMFVRDLLRSGQRPLREVVAALRERFGLSTARAYAAIDRTVKAGLARKERSSPGTALVSTEGGNGSP